MAWLAQCAGFAGVITAIILFFGIVLGSNLLFTVIAEDMTNELVTFNSTALEQKERDRAELLECFCDIIQLHTDGTR